MQKLNMVRHHKNKNMKLFNNAQKKIAFMFVVISFLTGILGWKDYSFEPTDFSELKTIEGVIFFGPVRSGSKNLNGYHPVYLVSENRKDQLHGVRFDFLKRQL